jgi:FtsP/CotA-like multicopper oxidase with cupredoxin domain
MTQRRTLKLVPFAIAFTLAAAPPRALGIVHVQCPGDTNGDAIPDDPVAPNVKCLHLGAGDGFVTMADGRPLYSFGFTNLTGVDPAHAMMEGELAANFPAPTIALEEGDELYLSLTNVGMMIRPDLFDPHTVHYHGFPEAASVFDGVPDASVSINMGNTFTYYYRLVEPGTYMYHCHVEATEHMQMGMLGNLYVRPSQDHDAALKNLGLSRPVAKAFAGFVYNDGDGTTGYDREFPIQIGGFDPDFHDASWAVQPLPFAEMRDRYPMLNGRGYPDTVKPGPLPAPAENGNKISQRVTSLVEATAGERILLRISNLNVTAFHTLTALGLPMKVVGHGARQLRGAGQGPGENLHQDVTTVTLGGGESVDVLVDTGGVPPGTYFLYATNLNLLSNDTQDHGGLMTEFVINAGDAP